MFYVLRPFSNLTKRKSGLNYFILLSLLVLSGCGTSPKTEKDKSPQVGSFPVIDAHLHTEFDGQPESTSKIPVSQEQLQKEFREAGVVGAVSHAHIGQTKLPDLSEMQVIHCYGAPYKVSEQKLEAALKTGKYRCIKVYLGYEHGFAGDQGYKAVYRLAKKYKLPVVFHTGDTYSTKGKLKYADPLTIDEVAVDNPEVTFVIAHCGNPWIQSAAEVAYKNPNVYLECSALLIGNLKETDQEALEEYMIKPIRWIFGYVEDPKKLMFGTDWPLVGIRDYMEAYKKAIPKEHWRAVFHDNAARVFGFETPQTSPNSKPR